MKIYWTGKSVPELAPLSRSVRRDVLRKCRWKAFRHWQVWAGGVGIMVATQAALHLTRPLLGTFPYSMAAAIAISMVLSVVLGLIYGQVVWKYLRPYLGREVDKGICTECGYLLIGLTRPRCPECGTEFDGELLKRFAVEESTPSGQRE